MATPEKVISLTGEEVETMWHLCYNVLSNASPWPEGLDVPNDVPAMLDEIRKVMEKLHPELAPKQ